jgi:hypothetical protein
MNIFRAHNDGRFSFGNLYGSFPKCGFPVLVFVADLFLANRCGPRLSGDLDIEQLGGAGDRLREMFLALREFCRQSILQTLEFGGKFA